LGSRRQPRLFPLQVRAVLLVDSWANADINLVDKCAA
jgi:hypothetical protein